MSKYGICKCFYDRNIFIEKWKKHVAFVNDEEFLRIFKNYPDVQEALEECHLQMHNRQQRYKNLINLRKTIKNCYKPLHPQIYDWNHFCKYLDPKFIEICEKAKKGQCFSHLVKEFKQKAFGFPVVNPEFCNILLKEFENFQKSPFPRHKPNTMNKLGFVLDDIGFSEVIDKLRIEYLNPLSRQIYQLSEDLDSHRAFTVAYNASDDHKSGLDYHFDNSEVTLNLCLSDDHCGGEIVFDGYKTEPEPLLSNRFGYEHIKGHAVLHLGKHIHQALPLTDGSRMNLIIWMRSSNIRNQICPMCDHSPRIETIECGYGDGFILN